MSMQAWEALAPYTLGWENHYVGDGHTSPLEAAGITNSMKTLGAESIVGYLRATPAEERTPLETLYAGDMFDLQASTPGTVVAYRREHLTALAGFALPQFPGGAEPRAATRPAQFIPGEADDIGGVRLGACGGKIRYRQQVVYGAVVAGRDGGHHLLYAENGIIEDVAGTAATLHSGVLFHEQAPPIIGAVTHGLSSEGEREQLSRILALEVRLPGAARRQRRHRWFGGGRTGA